jgi:uncharacterized membrane protein YgdD (TMEM256/DUF423 family)
VSNVSGPQTPGRKFLLLGAASAGIGVALGAFGAHGLKGTLSAEMLIVFETGVRYQLYHAFAMLIIGMIDGTHAAPRASMVAGWCFAGGTVLFSGSLYGLVLTGVRPFALVAPVGGVALLAGWAAFLWALVRRPRA